MVQKHQIGDIFKVKILRNTKEMLIKFPLKRHISTVPYEHEKEARYYIVGGVFVPLTINFLKVWGKKWSRESPRELVYLTLNQNKIDKTIDEIVVVNDILHNEENANYTIYEIVKEVDGQKVTSLNQFVNLVKNSSQRYVNILFSSQERLIFDKEKALQTDGETMKRYGISKKQRLQ